MPVHDWTRVKAGIFHDFHHEWIREIKRVLNQQLLPPGYYALAEQQAAGFGPDVLTLQTSRPEEEEEAFNGRPSHGGTAVLPAPPKVQFTAQTDEEFYRRKKSWIAVRHVSNDDLVAVVEVISPGNKAGKKAFRALMDKVCDLLEFKIHLLLIDLFPPSGRNPNGLHAAVWEEITDVELTEPFPKPLTLASYMSDMGVKAYVETVAVGDPLPDMPLFLEPDGCVMVPLEATYRAAFDAVPRRWREVLEPLA